MRMLKKRGNRMDITPKTKLLDLLNEFPEIENKIMSLAPPFKNLKNPILRKTVGKLATLEKVATIGGLDVGDFMNEIRNEIGLESVDINNEAPEITLSAQAPEWAKGEPKHIIDGTAMLDTGEHPLNHMNQLMAELGTGEFVLLKTNFPPLPMHDAMSQQKYLVYHFAEGDQHQTYVCKQ
jgi:hypothetical protein